MTIITKKHEAKIVSDGDQKYVDILDFGIEDPLKTEKVDMESLGVKTIQEKIQEVVKQIALDNEKSKRIHIKSQNVNTLFHINIKYLAE